MIRVSVDCGGMEKTEGLPVIRRGTALHSALGPQGLDLIPSVFNSTPPDDMNMFPNGLDPKTPNWKKAVIVGSGVATVVVETAKKLDSILNSARQVDQAAGANMGAYCPIPSGQPVGPSINQELRRRELTP